MAAKRTEELVRFDSLNDMPSAAPLSDSFRSLADSEADQGASVDPDAGLIPLGFWETAQPMPGENKEQITLRLDADVLRHFRKSGKGYQSRINAVLKSYMQAKERAG